jgi:hypothetical protein
MHFVFSFVSTIVAVEILIFSEVPFFLLVSEFLAKSSLKLLAGMSLFVCGFSVFVLPWFYQFFNSATVVLHHFVLIGLISRRSKFCISPC